MTNNNDQLTACFIGTRLEALRAVQRYTKVTLVMTVPGSWIHTHSGSIESPVTLIDRNSRDTAFGLLGSQSAELVVSAGFPFILPTSVLQSGPRFINSHPALLPDYPGYNAIKDAFRNREEYMGVTVHFMVEEVDAGPVIHHEKVGVKGLRLPEIYELLFSVVEPMAITKSLEIVLAKGQ